MALRKEELSPEVRTGLLQAIDQYRASGRTDTWDTLYQFFSASAYGRLGDHPKANRLEFDLEALLRNLFETDPDNARRFANHPSIRFLSGDLSDRLSDLQTEFTPKPSAPPEHMKPGGIPYEAPGPTRTGRHYRRAMTPEERDAAAMPPADDPGKGPGD